jgi:hypothetical protein
MPSPRDQKRHADQEQPVHAERLAHDRDGAAQVGRNIQGLLDGAVDIGRDRHGDEDDADRQQALVEIGRPVEAPVKHALEHHAHGRRRYERQRQRGQERPAERVRQGHGDIAAEHGEAAMRQVDEIHHPERHRQPDRQEKQQHPVGKAVEQDAEGGGNHPWPSTRWSA